VGRILDRLGFSRINARPHHSGQEAETLAVAIDMSCRGGA
jgi:hypothetical protein